MTYSVLITGGAGSLGRRLTERFVADGWHVRIFDLPAMDFSGFEGREEVQVSKGDIGDRKALSGSLAGVASVVHLAALLPPRSERDRAATFSVNVGGTENLIGAREETAPQASLVFASSVSTYRDTSAEAPPVLVDHPQKAIDVYADSKIAAESSIGKSRLRSVILRIALIAVPEFLEPPEV